MNGKIATRQLSKGFAARRSMIAAGVNEL